jgi:hypothetical protein
MDEGMASAALVRAMAAEMRGEQLTEERAAEIAEDLRRIVGHARAAAAGNEFSAEPSQFGTTLARLARRTDSPS